MIRAQNFLIVLSDANRSCSLKTNSRIFQIPPTSLTPREICLTHYPLGRRTLYNGSIYWLDKNELGPVASSKRKNDQDAYFESLLKLVL